MLFSVGESPVKITALTSSENIFMAILIEWMFVRVFLQQNSLNFFPGARRAFVTFYKVPSLSLLLTPHFCRISTISFLRDLNNYIKCAKTWSR